MGSEMQPGVMKAQKREILQKQSNLLFFFNLITSIKNGGLAIEIYLRKINNK
jgi:hypothetical protein